jgi:hypothetical protein
MNKTLFLLSLVPGLALGAAGDIPVEQADGTFTTQTIGGDASLAADGALTVSGGDADTAGALAANGANCSPGNAPLGVDTAGASEDCFDVWTEAENTAAGYLSAETDPVWALSPSYGITADQVTHWDTAYGWGDHAAAGYLSASSSPTITGDWTFTGNFNIGDPGDESGSIQLNGSSYTAVTKINDFGNAIDAELVLHRHSTSDANQLVLVRSHSNDSSHGDVLDTDDIGEIMFGGWNTASYYLGARIRARVDGTPGVADMPTSMLFQVAADGTANPTTALTIGPDKTATFAGDINGDGLTASELVATDASKNLQSLAVATYPSLTELALVKGISAFGSSLIDDADASTAQATLGVTIGSDVQAYDADLTTWAGLTPSANAQSFVTAANYAAMKGLLDLSGTNSGDQTITLTGDVTGSGTGSFAATIADGVTVTGWELGSATATTPSADDNDTSVATTAYVQGEINGAGGTNLSCASGSCSVTPAGSDTQVQWNNAGVLGAASTFTYDDSTYTFKLGYDGSNYCTWVSAADGALTLSCLGTDADFNIDLTGATDGDFSINGNDLFVDTSTGATGLNTTSPNANSVLDVYGKIYQNGVQSLYSPSAFTGTLAVGDGGGSLSHTTGIQGYYNTFVGMGAGGSTTTQTNVTANGAYAAQSNTGLYVTANGTYSAQYNTGSSMTASGTYSAGNNTGDKVTAIGMYSAQNNPGSNLTASGYFSARNNTGGNVTANGYFAASNNTGDNLTAAGMYAAQYNSKSLVTAIGYDAYNNWVNGTSYSVTSASAGADTVTVTGHGITIGTYVPLKVSGAGVGGLGNGAVYTFKAVDANTLQPLGINITSSGTTTLYANSNDFTNVTALGFNAEPTKDNQVMLGDANVVEVKTYATMLDTGGAITGRELSSDPADPDEGAHVCWQSDGTGTGDDGDILCKITAAGTTKTTTLIDFSAL